MIWLWFGVDFVCFQMLLAKGNELFITILNTKLRFKWSSGWGQPFLVNYFFLLGFYYYSIHPFWCSSILLVSLLGSWRTAFLTTWIYFIFSTWSSGCYKYDINLCVLFVWLAFGILESSLVKHLACIISSYCFVSTLRLWTSWFSFQSAWRYLLWLQFYLSKFQSISVLYLWDATVKGLEY